MLKGISLRILRDQLNKLISQGEKDQIGESFCDCAWRQMRKLVGVGDTSGPIIGLMVRSKHYKQRVSQK